MKTRVMFITCVSAAVVALSVQAAPAAEFHAGFVVTGTQTGKHVFTTAAGTVTCTTAHFEGTISPTTSEMRLTPNYGTNACQAFGFINVPVDVNGCTFRSTVGGQTHIECPAGSGIEITAPGCTTKIESQTVEKGTYANNAAKTDIVATLNYSKIAYNECGTARTGATYTGTTTLVGTGESSVWVE